LKLIFIYGPPSVGKLSVAKELARLTGFKLFHNHVSIEFVKSIFEFGSPAFWRLGDKYRREMLEEAAKAGISTIFTLVYARGVDDAFVKDILRRVQRHDGKVCFVRLHCDPEILIRRVRNRSRRNYSKVRSKSALAHMFKTYKMTEAVPFVKSLSIDTGVKTPIQAARLISRFYKLPKKRSQKQVIPIGDFRKKSRRGITCNMEQRSSPLACLLLSS
jgi:tRNA uridine 5-carbamoylmethylation protein Kti12